jgi:hypothetical protein
VSKVIVHPDAEVDVGPLDVELKLGLDDGVVPDRDALLIAGDARKLARDHVLDELRLALPGALINAATCPEHEGNDERHCDEQRQDRREKHRGAETPPAGARSLAHNAPSTQNQAGD